MATRDHVLRERVPSLIAFSVLTAVAICVLFVGIINDDLLGENNRAIKHSDTHSAQLRAPANSITGSDSESVQPEFKSIDQSLLVSEDDLTEDKRQRNRADHLLAEANALVEKFEFSRSSSTDSSEILKADIDVLRKQMREISDRMQGISARSPASDHRSGGSHE